MEMNTSFTVMNPRPKMTVHGCMISYHAIFFSYMCVSVWLQWVSVDELCSEEGFKGVWVSRSIVVVVLGWVLA